MTDFSAIAIRHLGMLDYRDTWKKMQTFTQNRTPSTPDELWLLEHPAIYTFGLNAKPEHLLDAGSIPVIHVDRGGEITYHGPGQIILYFLLDWRRRNIGIKDLVSHIEQSIIKLLKTYQIEAFSRNNARGVYVKGQKIAALGLRAKRKGCYHGLSLNVNMDLKPFNGINPCGYQGLQVTQLADLGGPTDIESVGKKLVNYVLTELNQAVCHE